MSNMKARKLINERVIISESTFVEIVVWEVPEANTGSAHYYKYRLALIVDQTCVMRYDNEPGKGDHMHIGDNESPYSFSTAEKLIDDFWQSVEKIL
jgi:hypothetical protein